MRIAEIAPDQHRERRERKRIPSIVNAPSPGTANGRNANIGPTQMSLPIAYTRLRRIPVRGRREIAVPRVEHVADREEIRRQWPRRPRRVHAEPGPIPREVRRRVDRERTHPIVAGDARVPDRHDRHDSRPSHRRCGQRQPRPPRRCALRPHTRRITDDGNRHASATAEACCVIAMNPMANATTTSERVFPCSRHAMNANHATSQAAVVLSSDRYVARR